MNSTTVSTKADAAMQLLRDEIDAIRENPARLYEFNASISDFRGIMQFYIDALNGKRSNSESVFITDAMYRMLEAAGFVMVTHQGLYFVNWGA